MKKEVLELREKMKANGVDVYYVPSGDYHSSEYVNDFFKAREFMSGLTGESGELIVADEGAYLWTDGRYFLQAERQLAGSEIELMRMAEPGVPTVEEFLIDLAKKKRRPHSPVRHHRPILHAGRMGRFADASMASVCR